MTKREELEQQGFKTYENDEIQVFWNPSICQHAGKCAKGNIRTCYNAFQSISSGDNICMWRPSTRIIPSCFNSFRQRNSEYF